MGRLKGQNEITNTEDIIDSREVIDRIEFLQSDRDDLQTAIDDLIEKVNDPDNEDKDSDQEELDLAQKNLVDFDESDEGLELKALLALQEESEGYSNGDWNHGATLIRDTYFEEYAQQLAEDIGAINRDAAWPNTCIDWKQAAEELQQDYTSVSFDGVDYWIR